MNVHAAFRLKIQYNRRQDAAEGGDNDQIRRPFLQCIEKHRIFHLERLHDRKAVAFGKQLDGRRRKLLPAPFGAIRLRHDADDFSNILEIGMQQRFQGRHRKLGSSHEHDADRGGHGVVFYYGTLLITILKSAHALTLRRSVYRIQPRGGAVR